MNVKRLKYTILLVNRNRQKMLMTQLTHRQNKMLPLF